MKKTLLVCLDNLGDLVFASAVARQLSDDKSCEISLWCKNYAGDVGSLLPGIAAVYACDPFWSKAPRTSRGSLFAFLKLLVHLRQQRFDEALILSGCWRTALSLKLAGIPSRIGFLGKKNRLLLTRAVPLPSRERGVVDGLVTILESPEKFAASAGGTYHTFLDGNKIPLFPLSEALNVARVAILHPFAGSKKRCAPYALWHELARSLVQQGYFPIFTGMKEELAELRAQIHGWPANHFSDYYARSLLEHAALWKKAQLFVGHDSGPLHTAHALGIAVLGLYLPGEPLRTYPQGAARYAIIVKAHPSELTFAELDAACRKLLADVEKK
jgi:ADP-heptose:LPS heptosyltransferase